MMDKQLDLRLKKIVRRARFVADDPRYAPALRCAAVFALSFFLSAFRVFSGAAPLGIAYAASRRQRQEAQLALTGAFLGSLAFLRIGGVPYAAAAVLCCTCRMVFSGLRQPAALFFSPLCAGVSILFIKSALVWGQGFPAVLALLAEAAAAGGLCLLLSLCGQSQTPQPLFALSRSIYIGITRQGADAGSAARPIPRPARAGPQLHAVSHAISELARAVASLPPSRTRADGEDISRIYDRAADEVCRKCTLASLCWNREAVETYDALNNTSARLRAQRSLSPEDFPPYFAGRCIHIARLCGAINEQYLSYLRRRAVQRRTEQDRRLMREGYDSLSGVLTGVADAVDLAPEYYPGLENRVRSIARAYSPGASAAVYSESGRLHVEVGVRGDAPPLPDADAFVQSLSLALGRHFCPPEEVLSKAGRILRISERERLRVSVCRAVRQKHGETVCGDSAMHFRTADGRAVILLSDGMGTGEAAERLSQTALSLVSQFIRSGCSVQESARAVLPVLAARFEEYGFVTLDLLEINLFSGESKLLKYGAAPTFVIRGGVVRRVFSAALPAGADPSLPAPDPAVFRLYEGDRIVMVSDGVCDGADSEAVAQLCRDPDADPQSLAGKILDSAAGAKSGDDRSVLVITLCQAE